MNLVDTRLWAHRRRLAYFFVAGCIVLLVLALIYAKFFYSSPTCFDDSRNGGEIGVDCGGVCARACLVDVEQPTIRFTRAFRVTEGIYNAVAYVENRNVTVGVKSLKYRFVFYGENEEILSKVEGTTTLPPDNVYAIFSDRIDLKGLAPSRIALELDPNAIWERMEKGREQFIIESPTLKSADFEPRLEATIKNRSLEEADSVEAVVTIFDAKRNPLTTSRIVVPRIGGEESKRVVFTWPEPIAATLRSCEVPSDVVLAIDLSGSINDDGGTPPEPLSTVLRAARGFANRMRENDQIGLVTFATDAKLISSLTDDAAKVGSLVAALSVDPSEERGSTNTGDGLREAIVELISNQHNPDARKVIVLLTDGKANAPEAETAEAYALAMAEEGKKRGIEIFSIGLGKNVKGDFVQALASDPRNGYLAVDRSTLDGIYASISTALCEDGAAIIDIIPKIDLSR